MRLSPVLDNSCVPIQKLHSLKGAFHCPDLKALSNGAFVSRTVRNKTALPTPEFIARQLRQDLFIFLEKLPNCTF